MKLPIPTALLSMIAVIGFGSTAAVADAGLPRIQAELTQIQYNPYQQNNQYQDQRNDQRYDQRDNYNDQRSNNDFRRPPPFRWRPGQVVPDQAMNFVVQDWEERGLLRPPGGHQWFRVRQQFLLIRIRDRMISRVVTFD